MSLKSLARQAHQILRTRPPKPGAWVRALGRPLSAAETEAFHGLVVPCSGYLAARHNECETGHPLWGWWEGPRGEYSRRPYLDAVWSLAVKRQRKREARR